MYKIPQMKTLFQVVFLISLSLTTYLTIYSHFVLQCSSKSCHLAPYCVTLILAMLMLDQLMNIWAYFDALTMMFSSKGLLV